jgi:predicted TIM-barrel fold metal-dependent hydrolase
MAARRIPSADDPMDLQFLPATESFRFAPLSEADRRAILWDDAAKLYAIR